MESLPQNWGLELLLRSRLPGEEGGASVFAIEVGDGCSYFGVTDMSILDAVDDVVASPFFERRSVSVSDHCGEMGYVVRCVGSDLAQEIAEQLRSDLVHQSSVDSDSNEAGAGVVVGDGCVFAAVPKAPIRMTIGDWMKAREQGVIGDTPKWDIGLTGMVTLATSGELTRNHGEARTRKEPVWVKKCGGPARLSCGSMDVFQSDSRWYILSQ